MKLIIKSIFLAIVVLCSAASSNKIKVLNNDIQSPRVLDHLKAKTAAKSLIDIKWRTVSGVFEFEPMAVGNTYKMTLEPTDYKQEIVYMSYFLRNVHIHVPQEHIFDSVKNPIEFHLVHSLKDATKSKFSNLVLGGSATLLLTLKFLEFSKM